MKKFSSLVFAFLFLWMTCMAVGAVPGTMTYQGRLTDAGGSPLNATVSITFSMYDVETGGMALWSETQSVSIQNGIFTVTLGSVTPFPATLFSGADRYVGIQVESDPEMTPRQKINSTAFSMKAAEADSLSSSASIGTANQIVSTVASGTAPLQVSSTTLVTNLNADMVDGKHASDLVLKAGDTMAGTLAVNVSIGTSAGSFNINNASNNQPAMSATSNGTGPAVYGEATGTGIAGGFIVNNASNYNTALMATTNGSGNAGLFQINNTASSAEALRVTTNGNGGIAVSGLNDGAGGYAGKFQINNASNNSAALSAMTNGNGAAATFYTTGTGYSGVFSGGSGVYIGGNLFAQGTFQTGAISGTTLSITGTKQFIQPHPSDPSKEVAYVAMEGPESAVFLRGKARLDNGRAAIMTPDYFRIAAGDDADITVQFTPRSLDSKGLAAYGVSREKIEVGELMNGTGTYEFDYFITAKRAGFEGHEPITLNKDFTANNMTKEEFEQLYSKDDMATSAVKKLLISNGILTADGKLNMDLARSLGWQLKEAGSEQ